MSFTKIIPISPSTAMDLILTQYSGRKTGDRNTYYLTNGNLLVYTPSSKPFTAGKWEVHTN